jgi:hypothetical protein
MAYAASGVSPSTVQRTLVPGGRVTITKTVSTPAVAPRPDIYFLADTTGSMGSVLNNVKTNAGQIVTTINGATNDPRYGAGDYKDFQSPVQLDPYAFNNGASIPATTDNGAAALAAIAAWSASGGVDTPEGNLFALHALLSAANFRSAATKIVVWFGDAPGHDPVCKQISGQTADITEASVTAELVAAGVRVIAVSTTTGVLAGLNGDPKLGAVNYVTACGVPGGTAGQADRIANATGGKAFTDVPPDQVSNAILNGLTNLPVTVTPVATCDAGLSISFDRASLKVPSGTDAVFRETLALATTATAGDRKCTVDFRINDQPAGPAFIERITIGNAPTLPITGPSFGRFAGLVALGIVLVLCGIALITLARAGTARRSAESAG